MGTLQRQTTLSKQTSAVFQMTLDQLQQSMGSGKPFGSMNMEDFLATVWDRENGGMPQPTDAGYNLPEAVPAYQNQNSVAVNPDYSGKTVEEVWNAIHGSNGHGGAAGGAPPLQQLTLGSFLQSVGVDIPMQDSLPAGLLPPAPELQVHAMYHAPLDGAVHISHAGPHKKDDVTAYMGQQFGPPLHAGPSRRGAVAPFNDRDEQTGRIPNLVEGRPWPTQRPPSPPISMPQTPSHSPNSQGHHSASAPQLHGAPGGLVNDQQPSTSSAPDKSQTRRGQPLPSLGMPPLPMQPPKQSPGAAARAARQRKRKNEPEVVDERVQRLQKRMVKNRESAARSRARKQQYTATLEQQVEELKAANRELLEKVIAQCPPPPAAHVPVLGGEPLRRTRTTPL